MASNYSRNTGISMKNAQVHAEKFNVITAIKLSDTDNVEVVGTDVNWLILLSQLSHQRMPSCVNLELVICITKYTIQPSRRLVQCQHNFFYSKKNTLQHKHNWRISMCPLRKQPLPQKLGIVSVIF